MITPTQNEMTAYYQGLERSVQICNQVSKGKTSVFANAIMKELTTSQLIAEQKGIRIDRVNKGLPAFDPEELKVWVWLGFAGFVILAEVIRFFAQH